ncbi:MAG: 2-oxo-4-hydroxy-4-carboxy-5-ureidoimidazoline decarboxylase [Terracidiphilus sp.]
MNAVLDAWNKADEATALDAMIACCGAKRWASAMVDLRPIGSVAELSAAADQVWSTMKDGDWMEAFACHPRIGERKAAPAVAKSATWSKQEQSSAASASEDLLAEIAEENARYEELFGFTYVVCATGKSAEEMLAILKRRLASNREAELLEAAEQQRQITQIRLGKWLVE